MLVKALSLGARDWFDLVVASIALGVGRLRIKTSNRARLLRSETRIESPRNGVDQRVERVRVAVARANGRLPWHTDCLVQALAARDWLRLLGIDTSLCIGVPKESRDQFEAHAWLMHGENVITGGDISAYVPILDLRTRIELDRSHKI